MPLKLKLTRTIVTAYLRAKQRGAGHTLENWLELRRNFAACCDFHTYLVRCIVGKRNFGKRLLSMAEGTEIASVSDEALALIGIENCSEVWDDVFEKSEGGIRPIRKDQAFPEHWKADVLPKHTRASKDDPTVERNTEDKRWNDAGTVRFNELRQLVMIDRAAYPDFKIKWLRQLRASMKSSDGQNTVEDSNNPVVEADDDLLELSHVHPSLKAARQDAGVAESESSDDEHNE
jgi:hypothetical protein